MSWLAYILGYTFHRICGCGVEMKFVKNVLGTFGAELVKAALSFVTGVLMTRLLSPANRGTLSLAMNLPPLVTLLFNLGLTQANTYFTGRKPSNSAELAANSMFFSVSIGVAVITIAYVGRNCALSTFLRGLDTTSFLLLILLVPVMLLDSYFLSILQGLGQFALCNSRRILTASGLLVGMAISLGLVSAGLWGAIITFIIVTLVTTLWFVWVFASVVSIRPTFNFSLARNSLGYGFKSYLQNLAVRLLYNSDLYLVAFFLETDQVAYYAIATVFVRTLWYIPDSVGAVLLPKLVTVDTEDAYQFTVVVCRQTVLATGMMALALLLTSKTLLPLIYGIKYLASIKPMIMLIPGAVVMSTYKVLARNFASRHKQQVSTLVVVVSLILNGGLNLLLIPRYGIVGAAISSTVAYFVSAVALLGAFLRDSGTSLYEIVFVQRSDLAMYVNVLHRLWLSLRAWGRGSLPSP
jgi:O-antigen/teichoic acid export membrane protein